MTSPSPLRSRYDLLRKHVRPGSLVTARTNLSSNLFARTSFLSVVMLSRRLKKLRVKKVRREAKAFVEVEGM